MAMVDWKIEKRKENILVIGPTEGPMGRARKL